MSDGLLQGRSLRLSIWVAGSEHLLSHKMPGCERSPLAAEQYRSSGLLLGEIRVPETVHAGSRLRPANLKAPAIMMPLFPTRCQAVYFVQLITCCRATQT